jgi:hypothetical protein
MWLAKVHRMRLLIVASLLSASVAAAEPTVDKLGIVFHLKPHTPDKKEWKWTPNLRMKISGPISSSSTISVEYTLPNGKPWNKVECENVSQTNDDEYLTLNDCGYRAEEAQSTNQTGVFGFTVKHTDALNNTNKVLFKGKFTVGRQLYNPSKQPDRNKQFYYYVDQDWRLPLATAASVVGNLAENLHVETWIKGPVVDASKLNGYLFFNGKQVSETSASSSLQATPPDTHAWEYRQLVFKFPAMTAKPVSGGISGWKLWENPGEYEVKVMRDNKIVRTFKVTIGSDGKPKETRAVPYTDGLRWHGVIVKSTVDGGDGTWRKDAWKTEAYFHNPVSGL